MIAYTGFRGAGKTRLLVADIYKAFMKNSDLFVITNTPLNFPLHPKTKTKLKQFIFQDASDIMHKLQYLADMYQDVFVRGQTIVIIDEANLAFPSRLFKDFPSFMLYFMAETRKYEIELAITTQHATRVDKLFRELTEDWVKCKSYGGILTIKECFHLDPNSSQPLQDEKITKKFCWFPFIYHDLYDTRYIANNTKNNGEVSNSKENLALQYFFETHILTVKNEEKIANFIVKFLSKFKKKPFHTKDEFEKAAKSGYDALAALLSPTNI